MFDYFETNKKLSLLGKNNFLIFFGDNSPKNTDNQIISITNLKKLKL